MSKRAAILALVALISSVTIAEARGGKTSADDCQADSADPDCPDKPPPPKQKSDNGRPDITVRVALNSPIIFEVPGNIGRSYPKRLAE